MQNKQQVQIFEKSPKEIKQERKFVIKNQFTSQKQEYIKRIKSQIQFQNINNEFSYPKQTYQNKQLNLKLNKETIKKIDDYSFEDDSFSKENLFLQTHQHINAVDNFFDEQSSNSQNDQNNEEDLNYEQQSSNDDMSLNQNNMIYHQEKSYSEIENSSEQTEKEEQSDSLSELQGINPKDLIDIEQYNNENHSSIILSNIMNLSSKMNFDQATMYINNELMFKQLTKSQSLSNLKRINKKYFAIESPKSEQSERKIIIHEFTFKIPSKFQSQKQSMEFSQSEDEYLNIESILNNNSQIICLSNSSKSSYQNIKQNNIVYDEIMNLESQQCYDSPKVSNLLQKIAAQSKNCKFKEKFLK